LCHGLMSASADGIRPSLPRCIQGQGQAAQEEVLDLVAVESRLGLATDLYDINLEGT
jgi:hypothetical protein